MILDLSAASEGELATLTLAGRQAAFREIMRRHREPIYRLVQGHLGDAHEALDVVQECFVAAFLNLHKYDDARPMRAWLARIAINKARDWHRRRTVRRMFAGTGSLADDVMEMVSDSAPGMDVLLADREELQRVTLAIASLPRNLKETLLLRTLEGFGQATTAQMLGISEKAVEARLRRARVKLEECSPGPSMA